MIKREFAAQIVKGFKEKWIEATAKNENISIEEAIEFYGGEDLDRLHDRISGKQVIIVENECSSYPFVNKPGDIDFFEKKDNNFVIPPCLFKEIQQVNEADRQ